MLASTKTIRNLIKTINKDIKFQYTEKRQNNVNIRQLVGRNYWDDETVNKINEAIKEAGYSNQIQIFNNRTDYCRFWECRGYLRILCSFVG
jgi:hypothetical protein